MYRDVLVWRFVRDVNSIQRQRFDDFDDWHWFNIILNMTKHIHYRGGGAGHGHVKSTPQRF